MYLWEEEGKKKKHRCFRAKLKTIPTHDKGNCYRLGSHYFMMPWPLKCTGSKHALVFFTLNWKKKKKHWNLTWHHIHRWQKQICWECQFKLADWISSILSLFKMRCTWNIIQLVRTVSAKDVIWKTNKIFAQWFYRLDMLLSILKSWCLPNVP